MPSSSPYTKVKECFIESIQARYIEYTHNKTGASIIQIENDDSENTFCITVPTHTNDSKGTPHILEHTVLCGSKKFPVKDPFFSMDRRSLNTFLNASTASDYTCYPGASQIEKDYFNLFEVYLDAVFYPNLSIESFLQEGHRLEFEKFSDDSTPLEIKGIVYNEMKGAMASPQERLWYTTMEHLYPDLPYGFNHGGIPNEVKNLTHTELLSFHKKYYHPTHSLFYFYGNIEVEKNLDFLEENLLKDFTKVNALTPIPKLKRFSQAKKHLSLYPVSEMNNQTKYTSLSWVLPFEMIDFEKVLLLLIIDEILMGSDAAILKRPILESKMCHQVSSMIEKEFSEPSYILSFQGDEGMDADALTHFCKKVLHEISNQEINPEHIESAIHQMKIAYKEINRDFYPYGLQLLSRGAILKLYGGDPIEALEIDPALEKLRVKLSNSPKIINKMITDWLIQNPHELVHVLSPSIEEKDKELKEETDYLQKIESHLNADEKKKILDQSKLLRDYQNSPENLDVLPKLNLSEVPEKMRDYPLTSTDNNEYYLHRHHCFTNGFVYFDFFFPLASLDKEDWPWFSFYTQILTEVGSGKRSFTENLEYTQKYISDFACSPHTIHNPFKKTDEIFLNIQVSSLEEHSEKALQLVSETLSGPNFKELERIDELLTQTYTYLESSLVDNAYAYSRSDVAKNLSSEAEFEESLGGYSFYLWISQLYHKKLSMQEIQKNLMRIHNLLFHNSKAHVTLCSSDSWFSKNQDNVHSICSQISKSTPKKLNSPFKLKEQSEDKQTKRAVCIGAPVAFTHLCLKTLSYTDVHSPYQAVAAKLLKNKTLHKRIREQGGAYGANAKPSLTWECFFFSSYRDPHLMRSIKAFEDSLEEAMHATDDEVEEAILNTLADIEAPLTPEHRAVLSFNYLKSGKNIDERSQWKKRVLQTKKKDIIDYINTWLKPKISKASLSSFADEDFFAQEFEKTDGKGFNLIK